MTLDTIINWIDLHWSVLCQKISPIDLRGLKGFKRTRLHNIGVNNTVFLVENGIYHKLNSFNFRYYCRGLEVLIAGNNNKLVINKPSRFRESRIIFINDNNNCELGETSYKYDRILFRILNGSSLIIGNDFSVSNTLRIVASGKETHIVIGNDCMFSSGTVVFNNDGHKIYYENGDENEAGNIDIGNHVWCGMNCTILKNTFIPDGSVIGTGTLVNKSFRGDVNSAFAGVPIKKIKENIRWERTGLF